MEVVRESVKMLLIVKIGDSARELLTSGKESGGPLVEILQTREASEGGGGRGRGGYSRNGGLGRNGKVAGEKVGGVSINRREIGCEVERGGVEPGRGEFRVGRVPGVKPEEGT